MLNFCTDSKVYSKKVNSKIKNQLHMHRKKKFFYSCVIILILIFITKLQMFDKSKPKSLKSQFIR